MIYLNLLKVASSSYPYSNLNDYVGLEVDGSLREEIFKLYHSSIRGLMTSAELVGELLDNGFVVRIAQKRSNVNYEAVLEQASNARIQVTFNTGKSILAKTYKDLASDDEKMVGSFLKFKYSKGSNPYDFRTIKVDSVTPEFICGIDVKQALSGKAGESGYRKYHRNCMSNITTVNL